MKGDLTKKKSMLENELTTILAVEDDNAYIVKQYTKHFQNELLEVNNNFHTSVICKSSYNISLFLGNSTTRSGN